MSPFQHFLSLYQKVPMEVYGEHSVVHPTVTVCVQAYQHEKYIGQCLDKILEQQVSFPVVIQIGEDNSTDKTRDICREYVDNYPGRILVYLHNDTNKFPIEGRYVGRFNYMHNLYSAKGKYIALCDGDDYWDDSLKLQKQIDTLEASPDLVMCGHDARMIDDNGILVKQSTVGGSSRVTVNGYQLSTERMHIPALSIVFRNIFQERQIALPYEMCQVINADRVLYSALGFLSGKGYKFISDVKPAAYRRHQGGIWSAKGQKAKHDMRITTNFQIYNMFKRFEAHSQAEAIRSKLILEMINGEQLFLRTPTQDRTLPFKVKYSLLKILLERF